MKKETKASTAAPVKSRKPKYPGCNSPVDFPKAFRCHACKGMLKGVIGGKHKGYVSVSASN